MRLFLLTLATVALGTGCATPQAPAGETEAAIRAATQQWAGAFNACTEPGAVASLYEPGAQVWGTLSTGLVASPEAVRQYFLGPCTSKPKPTVELGQFVVRAYGNTGISSGAYTFTVFPGGQQRVVPARFSFTFQRAGEKWLIVSHHSSPLPPSPAASQPRQ